VNSLMDVIGYLLLVVMRLIAVPFLLLFLFVWTAGMGVKWVFTGRGLNIDF
jgi:hypothetical protein